MRKRHVCPKCLHNHILLIENVPDTGEYSTEIRHMHIAEIFVVKAGSATKRAARAS